MYFSFLEEEALKFLIVKEKLKDKWNILLAREHESKLTKEDLIKYVKMKVQSSTLIKKS